MRNASLAAMVCALCTAPHWASAQEHEHAEHEADARLHVGLDFVLGLGRPFVDEMSTGATKLDVEGAKPPIVESFLLAASYEVAEHFALGARLGLSVGNSLEDSETKKMATAFTNLELEGEYETELSEHTSLAFTSACRCRPRRGSRPRRTSPRVWPLRRCAGASSKKRLRPRAASKTARCSSLAI